MADELQVDVILPDELYGSTSYTITVRVTNTSQNQVERIAVEPVVLAGTLLEPDTPPEESTVTELEAERRRLVTELERQAERACDRQQYRQLSYLQRVVLVYPRAIEAYATLFATGRVRVGIPPWAREALRIQEWDDVERLETEFIAHEKDGSLLRKVFGINKDRLERCLAKLSDQVFDNELGDMFTRGDSLAVGASLSYPFSVKAPHYWRAHDEVMEFRLTYGIMGRPEVTTRAISRKATVRASAFVVPTSSVVGALAGYCIRTTVAASTTNGGAFDWWHLGGSALLGLVFALVTARRPSGKQAIAVEDYIGGFIIGALAGIFSEEVLGRIVTVLQ